MVTLIAASMPTSPSIDNGRPPSQSVAGATRPARLQRLSEAVRQHPLVVLLVLVTLPAVGVAIALTRDSDYHATTTLLLGPSSRLST